MATISKRMVIGNRSPVKDQNHIERCIDALRDASTSAIRWTGIDPIAQQNAALGIYPPERCEAIKSYIAACRNEYLRCKELILAATTNDEADAIQYVAPPVPENI